MEVTTKEGILKLAVGRKGYDLNYQGNLQEDMSFVLNLNENGKYYVTIAGNKHKGSYKFSW